MRFFLETVSVDEARRVRDLGLLDGIATNPALLAGAGKEYKRVIGELAQVGDGPVLAEVISTDAKGMYKEARELTKAGKAMVVKIPMSREGLRVVRLLGDEQIASSVTCVATATQALLAARAGAAYVSPFVGALDDAGQMGMDVVESVIRIFDNYGLQTQILAEGLRSPAQALDGALMGVDVVSVPFDVLDKLFDHPVTHQQIERMRAEWNAGKSN